MSSLEYGDNITVGRALIRTCRQLDGLEKALSKGKTRINDFDIAPRVSDEAVVRDRGDVENRLRLILVAIDQTQPDGEYLAAKVQAHLAYLQDLRGRDRLPLAEYTQATMGVVPHKIPKTEIDQQYRVVRDLAEELGIEYNTRGMEVFLRNNRLSARDIESSFEQTRRKAMPIILEAINASDIDIGYQTKFVRLRESWINWISGDRNGMLLRVNLHPQNRNRWTPGAPEGLAIHEGGTHALQISMWKRNINRKRINPACGIINIVGPEQWGLEGLASTLPDFIPALRGILTGYGIFAYEGRKLTHLVFNNVQLDLNSSSPTAERELIERVQYYLPGESEERLKKNIFPKMVDDPVWRTYFVAYQDGTRGHLSIARHLRNGCSGEFLQSSYERPRTAKQIKSEFNRLLAEQEKADGILSGPLILPSQDDHPPVSLAAT